ncbi:MAG: uroporphyrinogen-III synthase [Thermoprotei archaeon]
MFLRPDGSEIPQGVEDFEIINISVHRPICLKYELPKQFYHALAFTSVNGVKCADELPSFERVYAVGPRTAEEVRRKLGVSPIVPSDFTVKALVDLLKKEESVLMLRSALAGLEDVREILDKVDVVRNYTLELDERSLETVKGLLENCEVDVVAVTSPSIAKAIGGWMRPCVTVISIGPTTSKALSELGVKFVEAEVHTISGILRKVAEVKGIGRGRG